MPATSDANGYTIANTPSQFHFEQYCDSVRYNGSTWTSTAEFLRAVILLMRNDGWNGTMRHLEYSYEPIASWGVPTNLLDFDAGAAPVAAKVDISNETFCYCESCKQKRYESNGLTNRRVHSYNYTPAQWRMHATPSDKFPYHMGVELETTAYHHDHLGNGFAADMRRPKQFWLAKRDGSVSGPEFASHPATLTWWHDNEGNFRDMFKMLTHAGFTSHNGGQAGMHVNISKDAFTDGNHLFRFMQLVTMRPDWSITMAQRTFDKAQQWARIKEYSQSTCDSAVMGGRYLTDKYSVVNILRTRYEFRLPRGTLRVDRFMKNLEWTAAMIGFARQVDVIADVTPDNFIFWVKQYPMVYGNLLAFLDEKNEVLTEAIKPSSDINSRFSYISA